MKKIILTIIFSIFLNGDNNCNALFNKYNIDVNIHSNIGWRRVCNNGLLYLYTNKAISGNDVNYMCNNCFIDTDVGIGSTLRRVK